MEVHFSPDVETRLQQVALANGKDAEQLVKDTVARMLENQNSFISGVQRGIEQADRGEFVEHKDVVNRIDRLFQSSGSFGGRPKPPTNWKPMSGTDQL
jgi:predicted transcriptional regulator